MLRIGHALSLLIAVASMAACAAPADEPETQSSEDEFFSEPDVGRLLTRFREIAPPGRYAGTTPDGESCVVDTAFSPASDHGLVEGESIQVNIYLESDLRESKGTKFRAGASADRDWHDVTKTKFDDASLSYTVKEKYVGLLSNSWLKFRVELEDFTAEEGGRAMIHIDNSIFELDKELRCEGLRRAK